jgi:hypothetical protein
LPTAENRRQLIVVANLSTDENLPLESALQRYARRGVL